MTASHFIFRNFEKSINAFPAFNYLFFSFNHKDKSIPTITMSVVILYDTVLPGTTPLGSAYHHWT
jgi:hypothetical protein